MSVRARRSSMKASDSRAISAGPRQPGRCAGRLSPATRCGAPTRTTIRVRGGAIIDEGRSEEHTSALQSLMRISYAVFCLKTKNPNNHTSKHIRIHHDQNNTTTIYTEEIPNT